MTPIVFTEPGMFALLESVIIRLRFPAVHETFQLKREGQDGPKALRH